MPDGQMKPADRMPILWIAMGRQRVGKTALLNTAVQYFRAAGNPIRVWNADQQNRSHTLSLFFPDAEEVPNAGLEDGKAWIEGRIEDLIQHRYDAVLDVGGGATGFSRLVQEVPLLEAIEGSAVRVVGLFCIGPEKADLDYLEQFAEVDMFMPTASVIVMNGGLVLSGRSVSGAFKPILEHPAIDAATKKGAQFAVMPALNCMSQVTDRGLTFAEAANGHAKSGGAPLSFFDKLRVNRWWTQDVPAFFESFPREWLPVAAAEAREVEAS
ncbi:MAG: FAD-binding oxidoreductase [Rhodospirillales bacterium]|nr:FAD-binding oxidoreductase [Rhodospirillales bacterium]